VAQCYGKLPVCNRRGLPFPNQAEDGSDAYGVVMRTPAVEDDLAAERALTVRFTNSLVSGIGWTPDQAG
jgi:hypothetical protein